MGQRRVLWFLQRAKTTITMPPAPPALVQIAVDLTRSLCSNDRYQRLLTAVRSVLPCDATALLALRGGELVPLAAHGLLPQVMGMRFRLDEHPRLERIVGSDGPVRFPADSKLADPFDGLVSGAPNALHDVHDCLGCPLVADEQVVGVLTADALDVGSFDGLDSELLVALGALAGAALQTTHLIETIERLAEKRGQVVRELTRDTAGPESTQMLGVSSAMEHLRGELETVAASDLAVLIQGETGVGKELAARAVHAGSARCDRPLIHVNCAALPESVVESELFGHIRGAFTGALADRLGKFELADGGTLFLDEIGELPLSVQPKLLRAIQEGEIQRVGSDQQIRVDVRIIAATNRDLETEVGAGRFRADLFHRLNVYPVTVPPLRERREDIAVLAGFFLDRYRSKVGLRQLVLGQAAADSLRRRDWPGNVRELDHLLARAAVRAAARSGRGTAAEIGVDDLDAAPQVGAAPIASDALQMRAVQGELSFRAAVDEFKRGVVERALEEADGNWAEAARKLGMHRSNLHHMARRLDVGR
jgi:anaerobic nitric oxide reductase transcription regulator